MKQSYEIGDPCWIYVGDDDPRSDDLRLTPGRVVHKFISDYRALEQYVILLDNPDFFAMEIRDVFLMSDRPDVLPPYVQRRAKPKREAKV